MASTPLKTTEVTCFVCCVSNSRCYKLRSRKAKSDGFCSKLRILLDDELLLSTLSDLDYTCVCRNCYTKITQTYDFIVQLRTSAVKYVAGGSVRVKRCALSPLTPKSTNSQSCVPISKSRKQLRLESPKKNVSVIDEVKVNNIDESVDETIEQDHGYSKPIIQKMSDSNPVICSLESIFSDFIHLRDDKHMDKEMSVLQDLRLKASTLTSRTAVFGSVLFKYRDINKLEDNVSHFLDEIIDEMIQRVPFLLKVMLSVTVPANEQVKASIIPVLASAYSILMKHKYDNLSAYHRLTSVIAIRGGLDERAQTRFNHLGLMLSWTARVNLQDSIQTVSEKLITDKLKQNPLIKITGDNLDIYVKTSHLSKERRNRDLHMFTSNIIFSRVATIDMSTSVPHIDITKLTCESFIMTEIEKAKFLEAYSVLLARILCKVPAFEQFRKLVPDHLPHEFSQKMSSKSVVYPLQIMMKNESKHEDCLAIMDSYEEELISLYTRAFGNTDLLRKYGVPVGGDQLTRVRLQEAKNLRTLSVTPEKRYDDLHPIVCEMWHSKQDFLEKCYKKLFKAELSPGTLNHFKTILHRTDVNGKVKGRFQPHFELLMLVGECMLVEQFIEFLQMDSLDSQPHHNLVNDLSQKSEEDQKVQLMKLVREFMVHYRYGMVDNPARIKMPNNTGTAKTMYVVKSEPDELYNYSVQLCHWYLHISELHDTAKEGDLNRTILNCQYSLPFFYSHSKLSKYLVENVDYLLKCKFLLSPLDKIRVLEGSYVNVKGGRGQNVESDLTQEHSVCNQKALIKSLGANKSEKAIRRVTGAADTISDICSKLDESFHIKPKSGHHSKPLNESDQKLVSKTLRKIRPFHHTPGRKCPGFTNINSVPVSVDQAQLMKERLNQIITRLTRGLHVVVEEDANDNDI